MNVRYTQLPKNGVPLEGSWLLVHGGEEHLKRQLVEHLRQRLLAADDAFNFDQLDVLEKWNGAVDTDADSKRDRLPSRADKILSMAQALPFLGSGRLVIVRNVDALTTEQQRKLAAAMATVPPTNHVLLVTGDAGPGNKPTKLAPTLQKAIEEGGTAYECAVLTEEDASQWVRKELAGWEQTIEPAALSLLLTRTGTELRRLQIEVDKLSLMIGDRKVIRAQDVELMTPRLAEESVFHLSDAVAARDASRAIGILRDLLEGQLESPYRIFPMVIRQFRLIWQTKVLLDAGWRPRQDTGNYPQAVALLPDGGNILAQLSGWMGNKLAGQARQFSWTQLANAYEALLKCDMASKAIEGVPRQEMDIALEMLCVELCS
ncbi:MAG: DNA polymerase III subunit delta [Armatimonadota bacterium]